MATWTKDGTTITLTADTLMSDLVNDATIPVADADTIQLSGHNLIVDCVTCGTTDENVPAAANIGVSIANNGEEANLEFKDWSGIRLNATLPDNVHPWVDPEHPLPVAFADDYPNPPYPDDLYRTNLTANARAEIQLNGRFGLGGGSASLPTETRDGAFYAIVLSSSDNTHLTFDRDINLHEGDKIQILSNSRNLQKLTVQSYTNETAFTVETKETISERGGAYALMGGGFCINLLNTQNDYYFLTAPMGAGSLNLCGIASQQFVQIMNGGSLVADRVMLNHFTSTTNGWYGAFRGNCDVNIKQFAGFSIFVRNAADTGYATVFPYIKISDCCCYSFDKWGIPTTGDYFEIDKGVFGEFNAGWNTKQNLPIMNIIIKNITSFIYRDNFTPSSSKVFFYFKNCKFDNTILSDCYFIRSGSIYNINNSWYHAPATAADVTWRYTDYLVQPNSTLRINCKWITDSQTSLASVAITTQATWWPQLWKLGAEQLAKVEFDSSIPNEQVKMLSYRNTSDEPMQVRVWECVTGNTDGGYLSTKEVRGGPM